MSRTEMTFVEFHQHMNEARIEGARKMQEACAAAIDGLGVEHQDARNLVLTLNPEEVIK